MDKSRMVLAGDAFSQCEPIPKRGWRRAFNAGWDAGVFSVAQQVEDLERRIGDLGAEVRAHEEAGPAALKVGRVQGARDESDRIRKELEEWLIAGIDPRNAGLYNSRRIVDEIDRICPKEPSNG